MSSKAFAVLILLMIAVFPASAQVVKVGSGQVEIGKTTGIDITLDRAPNGLSGYNITVSLSNTSVAEIVSVEFPEWATIHDNSSLPANSPWIKAVDLNELVQSGSTDIELARIVVRGNERGTAQVNIEISGMDDDTGNPIDASVLSGFVEVGAGVVPAAVYLKTPETVSNGSQFTVLIVADNVTDMAGFGFNLAFNSSVLQFVKAEKGNAVQDWDVFSVTSVSNDEIRIIAAGIHNLQKVPKSGQNLEIARITFRAVKNGTSPLSFSKASLVDSNTT